MQMTAQQAFEQKRYIYLSQAVTKDDCEKLTQHMFNLSKEGKLVKDEQCPLSESVYGDPVFDDILKTLSEPLSKQLGIELLPAYTYARLYSPGEELVKHKDRPSCEISGTMTLGFDPGSGIWPIYFGKNDDDVVGQPFEIGVGDLVMYRGTELNHWRPKYKGKWQVQVFFHWVDANGPYKDHAMDGRPQLGVNKGEQSNSFDMKTAIETLKPPLGQTIHNGLMIRTNDDIWPRAVTFGNGIHNELTFTDEECEKIIGFADKLYGQKSTIGAGNSEGTYDPSIRSVDTYNIDLNDESKWMFDKIASAVATVNAEHYRFDLMGITHAVQLLHYKASEKGHYSWHIDAGEGSSSTRKLSLSVPLTLKSSYKGGDLELMNNGSNMLAYTEKGSITFFPSYMPHRVTPVTEGERWVIVVWVHGSSRFR